MNLWKTRWRLGRCALVLAVGAATAAPVAQAYPALEDVGVVSGSRSAAQPPARVITVTTEHGFNFGAASIGAGGAIGAVLVASGSVLVIRRNRKSKPAEPSRSSA
jgi:hypothetical protein